MGKKTLRKTKTSKGQRPSISNSTLKLVAKGRSKVDAALDKLAAWREGKNPWVTVENSEKGTNRPFYKVRSNELWGNPKFISSGLFNKGSE